MKKLKLFFAACALLVSVGMQAQTWTSSEVGNGSFYIYNVGAKGYIVAGNNWGTRASINSQGGILTDIAVAEDGYTISTASTYAGKYLGADGFVDQGTQTWIFEPVDGENNVYKIKKSDGKYLFADADDGATTTSLGDDPGTDYAKWMLVTRANRIADLEKNASEENPIDATFLLTNPNFDRNSTTTMWNGGVALGGNNENYCAEKFNTTFDVYQTVNDAPKGAYSLAFQGFYRYGGHGITPAGDARKSGTEVLNTKLYANDTEAPLMSILDETTAGGGATYDGVAYPNNMSDASTAFSKGLYSTSMDFTVDVNTIRIGVKKTVTVTNDWTIFDNARLTYYGPVVDLTIYKTNLQAQVANATALYGNLPPSAEDDLKATVAQYDKEYGDVDGYVEAIAAIKTAVENAQLIATAYDAWLDMKSKAETLAAVDNDDNEANSALVTAITTQTATVEEAKTEEAVNNATSTLKSAMTTYVGVANPVGDDAKFDCTFMLTNPDLTPFYTGGHGVHPAGWATEQEDGNYQVIPSEGAANPDGIHKYCYEYWSENPKDNSKFNLYTPVTLPEGTYTMSCYAFADQPINGDNCAVYFYANDTQGGLVSDAKLTQKSISFVNDTEQEVKIGLKPLTGNTYRWMGIGYVELYKVPAKTYTVSENEAWDNSQSGAGAVTLTRTIKEGFNTLVLPFSMTQEEVEAAFGEGSVVYDLNSIEGDVWHFVTYDGISANRPCILKATVAGTSYNFADRTIVAGAPEHNVVGGGMTGSYAASLPVPEGNYIINGDKLYRVNSAVTIKGTRAYFNTTMNSEARTATLSFDGEILTGISAVESGEFKKAFTGDIFDLTGRKVKNPSNGTYVVEGKKVVF